MKDNEKRRAFIKARAEGKSYAVIAKELSISKSTCTAWNNELKDEIATLKDEAIKELYTAYKMDREAHIKDLGETLKRLDKALEGKDFNELSIEKLLDYRLKYADALKAEYIDPLEEPDETLEGQLEEYNKILIASQSGELSPQTARVQLQILEARSNLIRHILIEREKEANGVFVPFDVDFGNMEPYTSELLRHIEE